MDYCLISRFALYWFKIVLAKHDWPSGTWTSMTTKNRYSSDVQLQCILPWKNDVISSQLHAILALTKCINSLIVLQVLIQDCHSVVTVRDAKHTNFVEVRVYGKQCNSFNDWFLPFFFVFFFLNAFGYTNIFNIRVLTFRWPTLKLFCSVFICFCVCLCCEQFRNFKIIYRRYAGLYFCICVDVNDNNLCYLEGIHNFVEVLNEYFHNVCELDLVFNFYKVYSVVDEMFLAGEIRETSQTKVLKQLMTLNSLE